MSITEFNNNFNNLVISIPSACFLAPIRGNAAHDGKRENGLLIQTKPFASKITNLGNSSAKIH
jgi:hypothetical protein